MGQIAHDRVRQMCRTKAVRLRHRDGASTRIYKHLRRGYNEWVSAKMQTHDWRISFRRQCELHRWSYAELSRRTGINHDTMLGWLRSRPRGEPTIGDAIRLASVIGVTLDELFGPVRDFR